MATDNVGRMTAKTIAEKVVAYGDARSSAPNEVGKTFGLVLDAVQSIIAERDALRQACWDARAIMGFDNDGAPTPAGLMYPPLAQLIVRDAREFRRDYDDACDDRDRLAARCTSLEETNEGLEKLLRNCRDNYVEPMLRSERIAFKGNENCSDIPALESDLAEIDAALSPPASDATEPLAAGVAG